jgi:hypothetical protein
VVLGQYHKRCTINQNAATNGTDWKLVMSWIDDRISDQKMLEEHQSEVAERKRAIAAEAETIYGDLWDELKEVLKEFESKNLPAYLNGSPLQRLIRRPGKIKPGTSSHPGHEILVALSKDRQAISISGEVTIHLQLDVCDDGVVCMKLSGESISLRNAANKILDRFYFPELQPPSDPR